MDTILKKNKDDNGLLDVGRGLTVVYGKKNTGKTTLMVDMAVECLKNGLSVNFSTTENIRRLPWYFKRHDHEMTDDMKKRLMVYNCMADEKSIVIRKDMVNFIDQVRPWWEGYREVVMNHLKIVEPDGSLVISITNPSAFESRARKVIEICDTEDTIRAYIEDLQYKLKVEKKKFWSLVEQNKMYEAMDKAKLCNELFNIISKY